MNGDAVQNLEQFKKSFEALRKDKPREALVLSSARRTTQTIRIEPPQ
jgi:hypothetical protein